MTRRGRPLLGGAAMPRMNTGVLAGESAQPTNFALPRSAMTMTLTVTGQSKHGEVCDGPRSLKGNGFRALKFGCDVRAFIAASAASYLLLRSKFAAVVGVVTLSVSSD